MKESPFQDEEFEEDAEGKTASSPLLAPSGELSGLRPPSARLPSFTPFIIVAVLLMLVSAGLFFTAPKNMKPQHLHVCETQGPESHKTLCLH
ncbi:hypothetical protein [Acetobacter orleanensis]|uniref:Uncharacterized protein n=1 Tax=Acetobacter orleanensis TaxID=104099 RepID=A0A4Y3TN99_9PROT|nr:hypothetical protein [Acetobacter orleanensis]KXV62703.1 hypothetical protein AD949_09575 [Acetobacter orleanensis]PCD79221.1 hypothetical protein CO710_08080 [Acetobacter orleanensis]GAN68582.1 hypothetical protein Abol_020_025 [Acetobacter orleanensis JCM 7639]GEB83213.1 hypothetical protein AOR01nite_16900 [Acetobacter orleanensis]